MMERLSSARVLGSTFWQPAPVIGSGFLGGPAVLVLGFLFSAWFCREGGGGVLAGSPGFVSCGFL